MAYNNDMESNYTEFFEVSCNKHKQQIIYLKFFTTGIFMSFNSMPPLFFKSFIGFDDLFEEISRLNQNKNQNYPAFDVLKMDEKKYEIHLAVAGFDNNEIDIMYMNNILYIKGKKIQENTKNILHKGIALRSFEKKFNLDPLIEVVEAKLSQGMLVINLIKKDPVIIKPKKIEINIK